MTDEDTSRDALTKIHECLALGGTITVVVPSDTENRADERMRENRAAQIAFNNERDEREFARRAALMREQTAATVLAALIHERADGQMPSAMPGLIAEAVALTDALREALKEKP